MTFADLAPPILFTVFAWWFSTGAILWLVRLPRSTVLLSMVVASAVAAAALAGVVVSAADSSVLGAYTAFLCALGIWGWHEASFLLGVLTGPRPAPCPDGATGWRRFKYATLTVLHHEVALFLTAIVLVAATWQQPNQTATWTFLILFAMRLSAKFNIFLGVPNLTDEFFPDHLEHLKSYLPKRAMNALFPLSIAGSITLAAFLVQSADRAISGSGEAVGFILLFTLTALALIEHAFMILPLPDAALWRWAAPERPQHPATMVGTPVASRSNSQTARRSSGRQASKERPATVSAKD